MYVISAYVSTNQLLNKAYDKDLKLNRFISNNNYRIHFKDPSKQTLYHKYYCTTSYYSFSIEGALLKGDGSIGFSRPFTP